MLFTSFTYSQKAEGYLLIIGGGSRPPAMMERFIELAGGEDSRIVIIPTASAEPVETAEYQKKQLEEFGARDVFFINCNSEEADTDSVVNKLEGVSGIFFSGGDQNRLTDTLLNSRLLERIKQIYYNGGILAGTSAGAAVMSQIMITGDELIFQDSVKAFTTIQKNNIKTTEGFGFIDDAIIDQHFIFRKRHNRLISLVLENPQLLGIGIDESTAVLVKPGHTFEVIGKHQVIVYDAADAAGIGTNDSGFLTASNIKMDILSSGKKYDLLNRRVIE